MSKCKIGSFKLAGQGIGRVLGSLEAEIMEIIWANGMEITIREVWEKLGLKRRVSFNTVMTVMNRLVSKGLLHREAGADCYHFRPVQDRSSFVAEIAREVARGLVQDFGLDAIGPLVEALEEAPPEYMAALEDLLRRRRESSLGQRTVPEFPPKQ
ncbi:BlaI/MecI/CopY family transcriptional regulator [Moorellaceae bacterium AZ2]